MTGKANSSSSPPGIKTGIPGRYGLAWLPAPILLLTILVLWLADPQAPCESPRLLVIMNLVTWLSSLGIAWLAGRGFLCGSQPGLLMLGCGVLLWGLATLAASVLVNHGANTIVTIHNLGMLGAAACHLAGLLWRGQVRRPGRWLGLGYAGVLVVVALLIWAVMAGWTPVFFVQSQGGTLLRQMVLVVAIAMFGAVSWLMLNRHRRQPSAFLSWYGQGLLLLAVGLLGVMLQSAPGNALSWSGRVAQFLGGGYMLMAALAAVRKTGEWRISLDSADWDDRLLRLVTPHHLRSLHWSWRYGLAVVIAVAATVLRVALLPWIGVTGPYNIALLALVVTTILLGPGPGLLSLLLADVAVEVFVVGSFATGPDGGVIVRMALSIMIGAFLVAILHSTRVVGLKSQESEARLIALYASMTEGLASHEVVYAGGRAVDYILIDVNPGFTRITGITREQAVGARASSLYGGGGPPYLDIYARVAESGEAESFETDFAPMGKCFQISVSSPGKGRFTTVFADITERKRVEQALRESRALLQAVMDNLPDAVFLKDAHSRIIVANPATLRIIGKSLDEVIGKDDSEHYADTEVGRAIIEIDRRIMASGTTEVVEEIGLTPDGYRTFLSTKTPWRDAEGRVIGLLGIARDITERKQAEEALHRGEARLREANVELRQSVAQEQIANIALREARRAAVNLMKDAVAAREQAEQAAVELQRREADLSEAQRLAHIGSWYWDPTTDVTIGSDELLRIYGFDPATQVMPDFKQQRGRCYPEEDWERINAAVQKTLETGVGHELDVRVFRNNGTIWVTTRSEVVRNAHHRIVGLRGTVQDITERKRSEEAIKASLAEKEVLLREIHHRVKNNMQVISSLVSMQADMVTDERIREELDDVSNRIRSMALVHEKLYQQGNLAQIDFADYAASMLHALWRSHGPLVDTIQLNLELASVALPIETAIPCGLILNELALNAIKYAFPHAAGGEVMVGLQFDAAANTVSLRVRDNGVGLPVGLDWRQSPSLGLRLVQILTGQLRGTVEAGTGPGAEFQVTFPLKGPS